MKKKLNLILKASLTLLLLPLMFSGCGEPPLACFSVQSKLVDLNFPVPFDNCSQFQQEGYLWDFGDGATSSVVNPTHKFITQGEFLVSLTSLGKNTDNDDVFTDIIRVGDRILNTINVTSLPADNNGTPWDAADDPDVKIMFVDGNGTVAFTTPIQADVPLPSTIVFQETSGTVELTPEEWTIIVADDDAGTIDTMAVFNVDLATFEPTDAMTVPLADTDAAVDILYTIN